MNTADKIQQALDNHEIIDNLLVVRFNDLVYCDKFTYPELLQNKQFLNIVLENIGDQIVYDLQA